MLRLGTALLATSARAMALCVLWGYFVVPYGLPGMPWAQAAGLLFMLSVVSGFKRDTFNREMSASDDEDTKYYAASATYYLISLGFGWLVSLGM